MLKQAIIFGGSGFLGSHVADSLSISGHKVTIFDKKESPYLRSDQTMIVGNILDVNGKVIGKHEGIINFTIGQRKGIGIANTEALYVINIDAKKNEVTVGNKKFLEVKKIYLKDLNLLGSIEKHNDNLFIKVRSTGKLVKARANLTKIGAEVHLEEFEMGISPGQACVFYLKNNFGDKVLGGGWITKTRMNNLST